MGGSNDKIKVAIVDEKVGQSTQSDFDPLNKEDHFKVAYYKTFQLFLQKQSLKDLSYIIIRQDKKIEQQSVGLNLMSLKSKNNKKELQSSFTIEQATSLKQRFINYIEKYSLERLVLYLYVDDLLDCRVSDIEMPYFNLVSSSLSDIITSIKSRPQREDALNFKFKRLVKNLYRRVTVTILINPEGKLKWEILNCRLVQSVEKQKNQLQGKAQQKFKPSQKSKFIKQCLKSEKITSLDFPETIQKFQQNLISTYSEYVLVDDQHYLTCILDIKKQYDLDWKIIYLGEQYEISEKRENVWMVSTEPKSIAQAIKRCTDLVSDKNSIRPKKVVIFTNKIYKQSSKAEENMNVLYSKQIDFIKEKIQLQNKQKNAQNDSWIKDMKIVFVKNYEQLRKEVYSSVYVYLLTFDCDNDDIQSLKFYIRKNDFDNRVYLYSLQNKKNDGYNENTLRASLQALASKASFFIKFQITPLESIVLFQLKQKQQSYFSNKLGLITYVINEQKWNSEYTKKQLINIVDNNHIVCNAEQYVSKLRDLIEREIENDNEDYYKDIKIILYDKRQNLISYYPKYKGDNRIVYAHHTLLKIQQFLNVVYVPVLKLTIFIKKALPNFYQSYKSLQSSKSRELSFRGLIVSKNELLKEVFDQNILNSYDYQLEFRHFSVTNRNSAENLQFLNNFMDKYANLWRIGYNISKNIGKQAERNKIIQKIRDDLIDCLYKCKSYSLLEVSDDQFEYFYIKRLHMCNSLLQLQIATIYIVSLPHGFNNILELLFSNPRRGCMIPKVFNVFVVILLSAFCCVEDEVMSNINLSVNIDESDVEVKINSLNIGDTMYNTNFIYCGKESSTESHCIFIEFENIPMLSQSFIRHYLYVERFSFYKESSEYLIPPYTHFSVRKKVRTAQGKYHIFLHAVNDGNSGFIEKVFKANQIDHKDIFDMIKEQIYVKENKEMLELALKTKSLYKKAEIIGYQEEKKEMIKSIKDGLQYKNFLNAIHSDRYLSALNHLNLKVLKQKQTTQIQALYFKKMLGVQKSLVYFKLCEYDQAILELAAVQIFLEGYESQKWIAQYVKKFRENLEGISTNRQKIFNKVQKVKHWKILPKQKVSIDNETGQKKKGIVFSLIEKQFSWKMSYIPKKQQFYLQKIAGKGQVIKQSIYLPYKIKEAYGQTPPAFTNETIYKTKNIDQFLDGQKKAKQYFKYKIDKKKMQQHLAKYQESNQSYQDLGKSQKSGKISKNNSHKEKNSKKQHHKHKAKPQAKHLPEESILEEEIANKIVVVHKKIEQKNQIKQVAPYFEALFKNQEKKNVIQSRQMSSFWQECGITQTAEWQSFYIGDKFILTKKGKHYKAKATSKLT